MSAELCFRRWSPLLLLACAVIFKRPAHTTTAATLSLPAVRRNSTVFAYQDMDECRSNEYYDFDYFACIACNSGTGRGAAVAAVAAVEYLQPSPDKFRCECAGNSPSMMSVFRPTGSEQPKCVDACPTRSTLALLSGDKLANTARNTTLAETRTKMAEECEDINRQDNCLFRYINISTALTNSASLQANNNNNNNNINERTTYGRLGGVGGGGGLQLSAFNPHTADDSNCSVCDVRYNFLYQNYCLASVLMRPYLRYNAFWPNGMAVAPPTSPLAAGGVAHFVDLKYAAFFCLSALRNATACQQLANLCVLAHYAFDKHSPCGAFLLQQATPSDPLLSLTYAHTRLRLPQQQRPNSGGGGDYEGEEGDGDGYEPPSNDGDDDRLLRPFLFYKRGRGTAAWLRQPLEGVALPQRQRRLQLLSTTHALDGRLLRWGPFELRTLDLCRPFGQPAHDNDDDDGVDAFILAHRSRHSECTLSLRNLVDLVHMYNNNNFLSVFLNVTPSLPSAGAAVVGNARRPSRLVAVPVLIEDLTAANRRSQSTEWQLVKRFQPLQAHVATHQRRRYPGQPPSRPHTDAYRLEMLRSLRYIEHCELRYTFHASSQQIAVPLLRLRYRYVALGVNASLEERYPFRLSVVVEEADDDDDQDNNGGGQRRRRQAFVSEALLPVLLLAGTLAASAHTYAFRRRRRTAAHATTTSTANSTSALLGSDAFCDLACILEFLLQLMSRFADALLAACLLRLAALGAQHVAQSTVYATLPLAAAGSEEESLYGLLLYAALALKFMFLACHLWRISHVDLFFIDWERPRAASCSDSGHHAPAVFSIKSNLLETSSMCSSVRTYIAESNVSAWRIFFTANEWIRLSVEQPVSALLLVCVMFLVYEFLDQPQRGTHHDNTLRLCVISGTFVLVHLVQALASGLCGYGRRSLQRFTDLCSLANVSVFTLLESAAYGYYIHGRSPHGFADTDMSSMLLQLQRESHNMCGRRGLLSDSDQQAYIIVPPTNLRIYFEKLLLPLQRSYSISQTHYQKSEASSSGAESNLERTAVAYNSVNRFFCAFIDHAIKDMDYIIKEKSLLEKFLNVEFDHFLTENKGTFYIDNGHSFGQLFLQGNKLHLFVFNLLLIMCLFRVTGGLTITIVIATLFNKILATIFRKWVRSNVANKTLIDQRFLI